MLPGKPIRCLIQVLTIPSLTFFFKAIPMRVLLQENCGHLPELWLKDLNEG
jgi:hypothetical protein